MIWTILGAAASAAGIAGAFFAAFMWLFKLASKVAVLESQMETVKPVQIAKDIAWLKGAVAVIGKALHADLADEE